MRRKWFLLILAIFFLALGWAQTVSATPDAPRVVVNPATRECAPVVYWRDECGEAILPSGWEFSPESTCPADYTVVQRLPGVAWKNYQSDFCCMSRGEDYCPQPEAPQGPEVLPIAGGLSLLAGLGLGAYKLFAGKKPAAQ